MQSDRVNILIVDDRVENLIALEAVLSRPSYNIVRAQTGEEALARVLDFDFGVIIMDVEMPGLDGFETAHLIKQRGRSKDIPILFVTANSREEQFVYRGYQGGGVDYILKPFDPFILSSKVAFFVELYLKNQRIRDQAKRLQQAEARERGRQLAALQLESMNRYRHLADAVPHIIWKLQTDGTLQYCNRWWQVYSGLSLEQSSGLGWQSQVQSDDLKGLLDNLNEAGQKATELDIECRLRRSSDGVYRWHIFRAVPELGLEERVESWIVTITDIEDRKRIETDLIRAKEAAAAASQAKSAFLANMSHEIRTPLGIVLGFAELLAKPEIESGSRQDYFLAIRRNGELLSQLIGDILDLSKIEAGHLEIEKIQFSLPNFLVSATQSFQHQAHQKGIELITLLQSPIPTTILSDPMRLRQVLFNVVSNAIKFTEKGQITIEVRMSSLNPGHETLEIAVTDQGIGVTPEQAGKLFQPFIQANSSTTRQYGGTGLGLSLSRRLANQMGGDVTLAALQPPVGATFVVILKVGSLTGVEFTSVLESAPEQGSVSTVPSLNGVRVLIVEDAPENQFLLRHFLTQVGAVVTVANNGQEGVECATSGSFDIILMDIQMPVLDGYKATRLLREREFQKPILALTAYALKEERERCIEAGCDDHLTKPINRVDLINRVATHVQVGASFEVKAN